MTTCPDDDTLAAIASLPDAQRAEIADHAASCETCRALLQDLLDVKPAIAEAETMAASDDDMRPPPSEVPAQIDRYRITRKLGAGAMGVVYAGHDPELDRPVAVKVLRAGGSADRMKREAQALAKLTHPNVVAVYDVGEHAGSTFVTMALVDGENLRSWLATERSTPAVIDAITQAARGLEAAHKAGIVHRDIKPDNIFVARSGEVLVGDFGLARSGERPATGSELRDVHVGELTQTGALVGTPAYMAPEQLDGDASAASDQFALCVTAWEALYGARPFTGKTMAELVESMRAGPPAEPASRKVPSHVHAAIRRGLAADPARRHPSVDALRVAITRPRRRWPYVVGALAVIAIASGAYALLRPSAREAALARCESIGAPAAWTPAARERVLAKLAPPAAKPAVATVIGTLLDRYAADWTQLARTSCTAATKHELSEPIYAATKRCLDRRAALLAWVFDQPLPALELLGVVETLEPAETCRIEVVGKTSPEIEELKGDMDRASIMVRAAPRLGFAAKPFADDARRLGDPGTLAEASYLTGLVLHAKGHDPSEALQHAIKAAEEARDDRIRTRAFALLAIVAAQGGRTNEATTHRELAVSAAARAPDPITAESIERAAIAIAFARGDTAAEIAALQRLKALAEKRFGYLSRMSVDVQFQLAGALQRAKDRGAPAMLDQAITGLTVLADTTPQLVLEQAAMRERLPVRRAALVEQIVALARKETPERVPELIASLATEYELAGDNERAYAAALEARRSAPNDADLVENAATAAFELADGTDDPAMRRQRLDEALALLGGLPAATQSDSVASLRGRVLLLQGRYLEAVPHLTSALAAAEQASPPHPWRITMRAFALAQALWEVGGERDRDRARALVAQAAARIVDARAMYEADREAYGAVLGRVARYEKRIEAWRRAHP